MYREPGQEPIPAVDNNAPRPEENVDNPTESISTPRTEEDILFDAEALEREMEAQKSLHNEALGDYKEWKGEADGLDRVKSYFSEAATRLIKGKEASQNKAEANRENMGSHVFEARVKEFERIGSLIKEKKQDAEKNETKSSAEIRKAQADMLKYEKEMAEQLQFIREMKPDSLPEVEATIAEERLVKNDEIAKLEQEQENTKDAKRNELDKLVNDNDFEGKKAALETPLLERQEKVEDYIGKYTQNQSELRERRMHYSGEVKKFEAKMRELRQGQAADAFRKIYNESISELKEKEERFKKMEESINSRLLLLKTEKGKVDTYLKRIGRADKTANEEKALGSDKKPVTPSQERGASPQTVGGGEKNETKTSFELAEKNQAIFEKTFASGFGSEEFEELKAGLDAEEQEGLSRYLSSNLFENGGDPKKFAYPEMAGKTPEDKKAELKNLVSPYKEKDSLKSDVEWISMLFGPDDKMDPATRMNLNKARAQMPTNILTNNYSEFWAVKLYKTYSKLANPKVSEAEADKHAKKRIQEAKEAKKKAANQQQQPANNNNRRRQQQ